MKRKLVRIAWQDGRLKWAGEWNQSEFSDILNSEMKKLESFNPEVQFRIESKTIEVKGYGKRL